MANRRSIGLLCAGIAVLFTVLSAQVLSAQKDQTLNLPKDPPLVAIGDTARLVFHVSPLSNQGLLSQQVRDALKAILKLNGGAPIVHIRAFSAGNGDVRRIPQIVSDVLGDKHGPLPSVSVLQVGALPLEDAQVVLETISSGKKEVNRDGVTFHSAEIAVATEPTVLLKPLLQEAIDQLAAKMAGKPALSVTCFASELDGAQELLKMVTSAFPGAAINLVQPRRLAWQTEASCEGISRGAGGESAARYAFSGTQVAFGTEEKDAAVAIQHLDRALNEAGASPAANAALLRIYVLSPSTTAVALKQLTGHAPIASFSVEGVGPVSAGFAIDAVASAH
jgi:enamine deaminase RidA (YjgF/YER057c/UK114 family)